MSTDKFVRAVFTGSFDPITNGHLRKRSAIAVGEVPASQANLDLSSFTHRIPCIHCEVSQYLLHLCGRGVNNVLVLVGHKLDTNILWYRSLQ